MPRAACAPTSLRLLADGYVEAADGSVECPLHQALFDIRTGRALCAPATENLQVYPVRDRGFRYSDRSRRRRKFGRHSARRSSRKPRSRKRRRLEMAHAEARTSAVAQTADRLWAATMSGPATISRVIPDWVYTDQAIYEREIERIFHGRTWNYVALEAEVPNPGDFIRSNVGPTPVVVARAADGSINVFENRCAHRASEFCRELCGIGQGIRLPLSSMDLRSERQPDRHSVPPRRRRQGRHAGGFRHGRSTACASSP